VLTVSGCSPHLTLINSYLTCHIPLTEIMVHHSLLTVPQEHSGIC
jgi:hypothetical protein